MAQYTDTSELHGFGKTVHKLRISGILRIIHVTAIREFNNILHLENLSCIPKDKA